MEFMQFLVVNVQSLMILIELYKLTFQDKNNLFMSCTTALTYLVLSKVIMQGWRLNFKKLDVRFPYKHLIAF